MTEAKQSARLGVHVFAGWPAVTLNLTVELLSRAIDMIHIDLYNPYERRKRLRVVL